MRAPSDRQVVALVARFGRGVAALSQLDDRRVPELIESGEVLRAGVHGALARLSEWTAVGWSSTVPGASPPTSNPEASPPDDGDLNAVERAAVHGDTFARLRARLVESLLAAVGATEAAAVAQDRRERGHELDVAVRASRRAVDVVRGTEPVVVAKPRPSCTNCAQHGHTSPAHPGGAGLCSWCRRVRRKHDVLPGRRLVAIHARGLAVSAAMIRAEFRPTGPGSRDERLAMGRESRFRRIVG